MADLMNPMELKPKDILQFVENRAERALEVLREIIDIPEYDRDAVAMMNAPNQNIGFPNSLVWSGIGADAIAAGGLTTNTQAVTVNG